MPRDPRTYLFDIQVACSHLVQFTSGKSLGDYRSDAMLRAAVERQFVIIGETLNQLLRDNPALGNRITNAPRIIAFRNRLIHGYDTVGDQIVWGVLHRNVPTLSREVAELLGNGQ